MILYRWQGLSGNFGDELNPILWPRLLPDFFDGDPAVRFLGIGSVLDRRHSPQPVKLVAGTGYGGYQPKPRLEENWIIHWVRGPRTAAMLGLPASLGLGDPAVLVPQVLRLPSARGRDIGFMPHFESACWGAWPQAAEQAGIRLIDPRDHPRDILQAIRGCRLLLSEALHGVIAADALRIPWVAMRPQARIHRAKWFDWGDTMGLRPRFYRLAASTPYEWVHTSLVTRFHTGRVWLARHDRRLSELAFECLVARAAEALRQAANALPQLSKDAALERCQSRMMDAVALIRLQPFGGKYPVSAIAESRTRLQPAGETAYQL